MSAPVYLDHHATTPLDSKVLEAMMPYLTTDFGNPSSVHPYGWKAKEAVEDARNKVAKLINAQSREICFTSGATESNNLAIYGVLDQIQFDGPYHVITSRIEHKSILEPCKDLIKKGHNVTFLEPDSSGVISPILVEKAIRQETALITIQAANNEIGTIQKISEIGRIARDHRVFFHTDAVQYLPYLNLDMNKVMVDLMSLSGHKMNGPKGVGALYVRSLNPRVRISPQIFGSGQERGLRSGTLNVPGIVGLGEACRLITEKQASEFERIKGLRDQLEKLIAPIKGQINGDGENRIPNNMSVTFDDIESSEILKQAQGLAVSQGSACSSGIEVSHVLTALGYSEKQARGTLRFGLGRTTTEEDIHKAAKLLIEAVTGLRRS